MADTLVKINKLTKKYGRFYALDNCTLNLEKGKIYGLVGKNGAGKTTMMRIIAGLSIPTKGKTEVICNDNENKRKIGTLIEAPSLNGNMNAKQNLKFYSILYGLKNEDYDKYLGLVGLEETGRRKVKDFSLGMRQRLGIAIALLGHPEFVMLDEPVNGLDPIGIVEIRKLIHRMCEEFKMTVLVSSHNLPELYQTATDFIIIDKGQVKKEITAAELEMENHENLEEYFLSVIK